MSVLSDILETLGKEYDVDLRGEVSPFRNPITRGSSEKDTSNSNYFNITSYKWYTSDYRRMFERDYYNKIYQKIKYFPAPKKYSSGLLGQATKAIDSLTDNVTNYAKGVIGEVSSAVSSIKSLFSDDEQKDISKQIAVNFKTYLNSFQKIKVWEFKPDDMLTLKLNTVTSFLKIISTENSASKTDSIDEKFLDYMKDIKDALVETLNKEFRIDLNQIKSFTPKQRIEFAIKMYKNIISGFYTGYYEFPLFDGNGKDTYINSTGNDGWTTQSFMDRFAGTGDSSLISKMAGFFKSTAEMLGVQGFDIASRPKWSIEKGGNVYNGSAGVEVKFCLYNSDLHAFKANCKLVNAFVSGNLWLQDTFIQRSSSLYTVEIPGRTYLSTCTADVAVKYTGKIRKLPVKNFDMLLNSTSDKDTGEKVNIFSNTDNINKQILLNIPDIYEVTIKFTSLLPNNFNTYMMNIYNMDAISVGQEIKSYYEKVIENYNAIRDAREQQEEIDEQIRTMS